MSHNADKNERGMDEDEPRYLPPSQIANKIPRGTAGAVSLDDGHSQVGLSDVLIGEPGHHMQVCDVNFGGQH